MDADQLAGAVRDALAVRDRDRRGQLFRPDRGIEADARFVATVRDLAEQFARARVAVVEDMLTARAAPMAPERARTAQEPRKARSATPVKGAASQARRKPPGAAP